MALSLETAATRFNRYRTQRGHLFQGRYQALLVENASALVRLVHYINLNPVRAGIVEAASVAKFRWRSLRRFVCGGRPSWLQAEVVLAAFNLEDTPAGWRAYVEFLIALAGDRSMQKEMGFDLMCHGWAIGTAGWRRALAREYSALTLESGFERQELREIKETCWRDELHRMLRERGDSIDIPALQARPLDWKIQVVAELRKRFDAPYRWIAEVLNIEHAASLRMQVHRQTLQVSA